MDQTHGPTDPEDDLADSQPQLVSPAPILPADPGGPRTLRDAVVEAAPAVRRYYFGLCGDWSLADDLAQEALLKAWAARAEFAGRSAARTWVFAIARHAWQDHLRRRARRPITEPMNEFSNVDLPSPQPAPPALAARGELALAVETAMKGLPPEQREALALRESQGLSFPQIAELLGVPASTVKSRVRYALLKLADDLRPFGPERAS